MRPLAEVKVASPGHCAGCKAAPAAAATRTTAQMQAALAATVSRRVPAALLLSSNTLSGNECSFRS